MSKRGVGRDGAMDLKFIAIETSGARLRASRVSAFDGIAVPTQGLCSGAKSEKSRSLESMVCALLAALLHLFSR
jgi:hypothetical protein